LIELIQYIITKVPGVFTKDKENSTAWRLNEAKRCFDMGLRQ